MKQILALIILCIFSTGSAQLFGQEELIKGKVTDLTNTRALSKVSISIKGSSNGTITQSDGSFALSTNQEFPLILVFSSIGYETMEVSINNADNLAITLNPYIPISDEVVVAATRVPVRIMESPVSIERLGLKAIRQSPAPSYYDALASLKGVDVTTASLTFKTISTRGFNGSGSSRVNQLVDGMDNQAPGLNFNIGNLFAVTELDVESVEILPGASSALYGPGGMNGTVLINSKSPFNYPGFSILAKQGVTNVDKSQRDHVTPYYDWSMRWAKQVGQHFALKVGGQWLKATDWLAHDSRNFLRRGTRGQVIAGSRESDPNYDGINIYGDEGSGTPVDIRPFLQPFLPAGHDLLKSPIHVSRTGYPEKELVDPETINWKISGAAHYKIKDSMEAIIAGSFGNGSTVYTGSNRYAFKDVRMGQYKLELKNRNWFLRGYTSQENAGDTYSPNIAALVFNEIWKPSFNPANIPASWYPQYAGAFLQAAGSGAPIASAHNTARAFADQGRPIAGTPEFKAFFDKVKKVPIPNGGLLIDKSDLWAVEGQYSFSNRIKFAEVVVGANWKKYILNSEGTIFIDTAETIKIEEYGAYVQATKKLWQEKLTISASGRYDKNENFKGNLTPRIAAVFKIARDNNLRLSYQTAYRFPTTLYQFIRLKVGGGVTLLGGLPWINDYMGTSKLPAYEVKNGMPSSSSWTYKDLKPERSSSFEIGYKGLFNSKFMIDAYAYYGHYKDFLGRVTLIQPINATSQNFYSIVENTSTKVKTWGYGLGFDYHLPHNFSLFANFFSDHIEDVPIGFVAAFNTPTFRLNAGFGNTGLGDKKRLGFNIVYRWQDSFYNDGDFAEGVVPAFSTLDAQISYKFPTVKSVLRLGGTNILNHYYQNGFASPRIGGLYYIAVAYNIF